MSPTFSLWLTNKTHRRENLYTTASFKETNCNHEYFMEICLVFFFGKINCLNSECQMSGNPVYFFKKLKETFTKICTLTDTWTLRCISVTCISYVCKYTFLERHFCRLNCGIFSEVIADFVTRKTKLFSRHRN